MARRPEGWTLVEDPRTGNWLVRFRREDGSRVMRSSGTRDRRAAQAEAARIYRAEVGRTVERITRGRTRLDDELVAQWIRDFSATHSPETVEAYEAYAAVHWLPRWPTVESIDPAVYVRDRLRNVTASTVRKEASALRAFLGWLVEHGTVAEAPIVPSVPKRATGTPYDEGKRTPRRIDLDAPTVRRILDAITDEKARDVAELIWETTLRIATIERLAVPRHYRRGADEVHVTADIDKARMDRRVPLSNRAREILDSHALVNGPIFGEVALRYPLIAAAVAAGLDLEDARRVSSHDLRHAAITDLVSRPGVSLGGAAYLAGHRHVSTTALYSHPGRAAAEEALRARIGIPSRDTDQSPKRRKR